MPEPRLTVITRPDAAALAAEAAAGRLRPAAAVPPKFPSDAPGPRPFDAPPRPGRSSPTAPAAAGS